MTKNTRKFDSSVSAGLQEIVRQYARLARAPTGLLVGVLGIAAPAQAAGEPPICHTSFDSYKASAETRQACGIKSHPLQSKVVHPDGSTDYTFVVDGQQNVYHLPPPGWKPLEASAAERAKYGIPPEPSDPQMQEQWRSALENIKFVAPGSEVLTVPVKNSPPPMPSSSSGSTSSGSSSPPSNGTNTTRWAGVIDTGLGYSQAYGGWVQPSNHGSCGGAEESTWVGLQNGWLAQDGTYLNINGTQDGQGWYEIYPNPPVLVSPTFVDYPGDNMWAETQTDPSNNAFQFKMYDGTQNVSTGYISVPNPTGDRNFEGSAEFLIERPGDPSQPPPPLVNFGQINWYESYANGVSSDQLSNTTDWMYGESGGGKNVADLLASTSVSVGSSGSFQNSYVNCS